MTNATEVNAKTFAQPPTMSGASITSGTIPAAAFVSPPATLSGSQTFSGQKTFTLSPIFSSAVFNNTAATVVPGSTSGDLSWIQSEQGAAYKRVVIYCNALLGTATVTFATAFLQTPVIVTTSGLSGALITTGPSTTSCIVTGATSTGFLIIEGY